MRVLLTLDQVNEFAVRLKSLCSGLLRRLLALTPVTDPVWMIHVIESRWGAETVASRGFFRPFNPAVQVPDGYLNMLPLECGSRA